jgi:transcriptional regulator with XRE-family HTH domain
MTTISDGICDWRLLTPAELARVIVSQREGRKWTQETLAEIARLTVRTVQRVEGGDPSSADTRRALARALDWQDLDVFNKAWPIPNEERLKAETERIERETVSVTLERITTGRRLREFAETSNAHCFSELVELAPQAEEVFAEMQDYYKDYADVDDCYSATEKLDVNKAFQEMIERLSASGYALGGGTRHVRWLMREPAAESLPLIATYIVVGPEKSLPPTIRVPRRSQVGF